jgi:hypothetical protein
MAIHGTLVNHQSAKTAGCGGDIFVTCILRMNLHAPEPCIASQRPTFPRGDCLSDGKACLGNGKACLGNGSPYLVL